MDISLFVNLIIFSVGGGFHSWCLPSHTYTQSLEGSITAVCGVITGLTLGTVGNGVFFYIFKPRFKIVLQVFDILKYLSS